jgi:predicted ThiF/HesA family dinucleotide-utilizing enzyme
MMSQSRNDFFIVTLSILSITSAKNGKEYLIVIDGQKQNKNDLIKVDMDAEIASSITLPATLAEKNMARREQMEPL